MQQEILRIEEFIKNTNLKVTGPKISTIFSVNQAMVPTMDIEILVPVDKEFSDTTDYKFKKEF